MAGSSGNNQARSKTALVTGGTDGIGKEIAIGLAADGQHVIIVGHDESKGIQAKHEILAASGNINATVEFICADLSLVSETERLVKTVTRCRTKLDYLVPSAGVVLGHRSITSEGIETNFALNYLSRFVLIKGLLPMLCTSGRSDAPSRILLISGAAMNGAVYFDDVNLTRNFSTIRAVRQFCRANDLLTIELAAQLTKRSSAVTINCLKYGVVKTHIRKNFPWWMKVLVPLLFDPFLGQTPRDAARDALNLLLADEFARTNGSLFLKIREFKKIPPFNKSVVNDEGQRLWMRGEQIVAAVSQANAAA